MSNEIMPTEQINSFEQSNNRATERLCGYTINRDSALKMPTDRKELNLQQKEEISKLLKYIIDRIGTSITIELLRELKTKVDYM